MIGGSLKVTYSLLLFLMLHKEKDKLILGQNPVHCGMPNQHLVLFTSHTRSVNRPHEIFKSDG